MNKTEKLAHYLINGYVFTDYCARKHKVPPSKRWKMRESYAATAVGMIHELPRKQIDRAITMADEYFDRKNMTKSKYQIFLATGDGSWTY